VKREQRSEMKREQWSEVKREQRSEVKREQRSEVKREKKREERTEERRYLQKVAEEHELVLWNPVRSGSTCTRTSGLHMRLGHFVTFKQNEVLCNLNTIWINAS
jgi:hypothetical protein